MDKSLEKLLGEHADYYKKGLVFIEKILRKKADGTEIPVGVHASKVVVLDLYMDDAKRFKKRNTVKEKKKVE